MMEIVQAVLFTSKYILGKGGNYDLYYIFSALVLVWYFFKRTNAFFRIIKYYLPFAFVGMIMLAVYPHIDMVKAIVFLIKMLLNTALMVFVIEEYHRLNLKKIAVYSCVIFALETALAIIYPSARLWRYNDVVNRFTSVRLQLFYIEPSELAFHCGILAIFFIYLIFQKKENINLKNLGCLIILLMDMLLTAGMGGILAVCIAVVVMVVYLSVRYLIAHSREGVWQQRKIVLTYMVGVLAFVAVIFSGSAFTQRMQAVLSGQDSSFLSRFVQPISVLGGVLEKTGWLGCGFGNLNTAYGLEVTGLYFVFPNSIPYFIAEAGIFAILFTVIFCAVLFWQCIREKDAWALILFVYIIVYQLPGGYFTNPVNYLVYGLIIGRLQYLKKKRRVEYMELVTGDNEWGRYKES